MLTLAIIWEKTEEMKKDLEGAIIEQIGEGIKINFDSGILFTSRRQP